MARLIPLLTLIPTIFTLIATILINVGGVSPGYHTYSTYREGNPNFKLLSWNFTVTPGSSNTQYYSYSLHLNRLCFATHVNIRPATSSTPVVSTYCRNNIHYAHSKISDGRSLYSTNTYVNRVSPFRFTPVLLAVPVAFFILTAITLVFLMLAALVCGFKSKSRPLVSRTRWAVSLGIAVVTLVFMLIASSVLTWQVTNLRQQIENETLRVRRLSGGAFSTGLVDYVTDVNHTELGSVVLGLMWSGVVAMGLEVGLWAWAWFAAGKERVGAGMSTDKKVHGETRDSYVMGN